MGSTETTFTTSKSNVRSTEENELFSVDSFTVAPNNAENMSDIAQIQTTLPSSAFQEDTKLTKIFSVPAQKASSNFTTDVSVVPNESIQTSTYTTQYFIETDSNTLKGAGTVTERPTYGVTFSTDNPVTSSSTNFTPDLSTESQTSLTQSEAKPSTEAKTESFTPFDGLDSTAITTGIEDATENSDGPTISRAPLELTNTDVTTSFDQTLTSNTPSTIKFASITDSEMYTDQKSILDSTSAIRSTSVTDPGGSRMTDPEFIKIDKTNASIKTNENDVPIQISTSTKASETRNIDLTSKKLNDVKFYRSTESTHLGREQITTGSSTITESASMSSLTTKLWSTSKSITPKVPINLIDTTAVSDTTSTSTYPETSLEPATGFSPVEITTTTDFLTTFGSTTEEVSDGTKTQVTSPTFSTIKSTVPEPITLSKFSTFTEKPFSSKTFPAVGTSQTMLMFETSSTDLIKLPVSENIKTSDATTASTTTSQSVSNVILTIRPSVTQTNPDFWKRSTDNADTTKIDRSKITERPPIQRTIESSTRGRLEPISHNR